MASDTLDFEKFVAALPDGLGVPEDLQSGSVQRCVARADFVPPRMRLQSGEPGSASVILVSAAGAVGKSTVARAVAAQKEAAYWDLSTTQVGSQSFVGMLATVYGESFAAVKKYLRDGERFLVIDALDEAQVRSGPANFDSFLTDLAASLTESRDRPALLVFGRVDTIDWIALHFDECGVPFAHYGIDFFDKDQAYAFIDQALDHRRRKEGANAPHRRHPLPFARARDGVFELLYVALKANAGDPWQDETIRTFLGYAPVLESLVDYLDVSDWQQLHADIDALGGELGSLESAGPGHVLLTVVRRIIDRERRKMVQAVGPAVQQFQPNQPLPDLYDESEQLARLLASILGLPAETQVPLTGAALQCYESHIESQVPQHPFRRGLDFSSVVFKEYCVAWAFANASPDTRISVSQALASKTYRPTHLLAQFYFSLTNRDASLEGEAFGLLYESAREPVAARTTYLIISPGKDGTSVAELIPSDQAPGAPVPTVHLNLLSPITFWYHLTDAMVFVPGPVQFGFAGAGFVLGPSVVVVAQLLKFRCSAVQVFCPDRNRDVYLRSRETTE